jgi:alanine dehydrogenase
MTYILRLANDGLAAVRNSADLCHGLNTHRGYLTHQAVAQAFGIEYTEPTKALLS